MTSPTSRYAQSVGPYRGLPDLHCPFRDREPMDTACGRLCLHRKKINISTDLAGQKIAVSQVDDGIWHITFIDYDLGYVAPEQRTLQTFDNTFGTRLSPGVLEKSVTHTC